jgi:hypothetical protein
VQTPHVTTSRSILANQRSSRLSQEGDVGVEMEPDAGPCRSARPRKGGRMGQPVQRLKGSFLIDAEVGPNCGRIQIEPDNVSGFGSRLKNVMDLMNHKELLYTTFPTDFDDLASPKANL